MSVVSERIEPFRIRFTQTKLKADPLKILIISKQNLHNFFINTHKLMFSFLILNFNPKERGLNESIN